MVIVPGSVTTIGYLFYIDIYGYRIYNMGRRIYGDRIRRARMDDYKLEHDGIADGMLVEKIDLKKVDADKKKECLQASMLI